MSTLAVGPAERTEWHGTDVEADELAERLLRMNRDHVRDGHGHAATRTLNLLVAPGRDVAEDLLAQRLEELRTRHPSRTVVVREHAPARLDATLAIECSVCSAAGGTGFCHDAAHLRAGAERLGHADSLVHPLLVSGLPTVLWLPGAQPSPAEEPLTRVAEAVVLDSGAAGGATAAAAFARATQIAAVGRVRDLAWLRLARWRQRIAVRFDDPATRALLGAVERVELRCCGPDAATPLLLIGWVAARVGWTLVALDPDQGAWSGTAQRGDGRTVAIALGPGREDAAGIHALTFSTSERSVEIVEPVAEPDDARTFAAALRTFDETSPGYVPALAALNEGLGPR